MTWAKRVFDPLILGQWGELFLFYSTRPKLILSFLGVGVHVCVRVCIRKPARRRRSPKLHPFTRWTASEAQAHMSYDEKKHRLIGVG